MNNFKSVFQKVDKYLPFFENKIIGLGTGLTMNSYFSTIVPFLKKAKNLIATSNRTKNLISSLGLTCKLISYEKNIDLMIDGFDFHDGKNYFIKGYGGALLLEKKVFNASKSVFLVGASHKFTNLIHLKKIPVEYKPSNQKIVSKLLLKIFRKIEIRKDKSGRKYLTHNKNNTYLVSSPIISSIKYIEKYLNMALMKREIEGHGIFNFELGRGSTFEFFKKLSKKEIRQGFI